MKTRVLNQYIRPLSTLAMKIFWSIFTLFVLLFQSVPLVAQGIEIGYCENLFQSSLEIKNESRDSQLKELSEKITDSGFKQFHEFGPLKFFEFLSDYRDRIVPKFINRFFPISGETSILYEPFLASFEPESGDMYDERQNFLSHTFKVINQYVFRRKNLNDSTDSPKMTVYDRLVYDRNDEIGEPMVASPLGSVFHSVWTSLNRLYESFDKQGPERTSLVEIVKGQDLTDNDNNRVTHFLTTNGSSPLSHIQILLASRPGETLHITDQWREKSPNLPGPRKGELGRFFIFPRRELNSATPTPVQNWQDIAHIGPFLRIELFRRAFAWSNQDAELDSLSLQVNRDVLAKLNEMGIPTHLANSTEVSTEFEGKKIPEFILVFDRYQLRMAENILMQRHLLLYLKQFIKTHETMNPSPQKMILRFKRNEIRSLLESGLFGDKKVTLLENLKSKADKNSELRGPTYARVLSKDLMNSRTDENGYFLSHVVSPKQLTDGYYKPTQVLNITDLTNIDETFQNGIFEWPSSQATPVQTSTLELHFTQKSARAAIKMIQLTSQ